MVGAMPRYGTKRNSVPVTFWKLMPWMWPTEPTPEVPISASPGCAFSQAMKPLRSSAGMVLRATIASSPLAIQTIGANAVRRS